MRSEVVFGTMSIPKGKEFKPQVTVVQTVSRYLTMEFFWKVYCKAGNPIPTSSPNPCTMLLRTTGVDLSMGIPSTTDTSTKTIGSRYVKSHSDISFLQQLQPEWGLSVSIYLFTDVIYFSFTDLSKTSIRSKQQPVQDGSITSITPETIHLSVPLG